MALDAYSHLSRAPKGGAAPLVFAFHGTGGDEHQFDGLVAQLLPDAGLIAPRGDVSEFGAARFFKRTGEGRYDMADLARATKKMAGFIAAHKAANPGRPIYGLGYSNGANILATVLMAQPDLIDRAALLHPLIPFDPQPQQGLSGKQVLITAGERDPICPWPMTEALADWFTAQGADLTLQTHPGGHEMRQEELQALAGFFTASERNAA